MPSVIKYEYAISVDPNLTSPQPGSFTSQTSILLTGLSSKQDYKFWLRAWCSPTPTSDWGGATFLTQPGLGIANAHEENTSFYAYPNPATDMITIAIPGKINGNASLAVTDIMGKVVRTVTVTSNKLDISLSGLANGIYQIRFTDADHTSVKSISKQ